MSTNSDRGLRHKGSLAAGPTDLGARAISIADRAMLLVWAITLVGYFGPWITRSPASAALSWNAYDLFALLRLLPDIQSGTLWVYPQALQLPLLALVTLLPLLTAHWRLLPRIGVAFLGSALAALTFPPYPEIITAWKTPGWRVPFWWGVGCIICVWIAIWAAPRIGKARHWISVATAELAVFPAVATLARLSPPLSALHAAQIVPGWGFWVSTVGLCLIGVLAGLRTREAIDGRHP